MIFAGDFSILLPFEVLFHPVVEGLVVASAYPAIPSVVHPTPTSPPWNKLTNEFVEFS